MPKFSRLNFLQWLEKNGPNRCARALLEASIDIHTVYPMVNGKISEKPHAETVSKILWAMEYLNRKGKK